MFITVDIWIASLFDSSSGLRKSHDKSSWRSAQCVTNLHFVFLPGARKMRYFCRAYIQLEDNWRRGKSDSCFRATDMTNYYFCYHLPSRLSNRTYAQKTQYRPEAITSTQHNMHFRRAVERVVDSSNPVIPAIWECWLCVHIMSYAHELSFTRKHVPYVWRIYKIIWYNVNTWYVHDMNMWTCVHSNTIYMNI